jgi:CRP-like cAMP-binding protein
MNSIKRKTNCATCKHRSCSLVLNEKQIELMSNNSSEIDIKKKELIMRSGVYNSHIIFLKKGFVKEFLSGHGNKTKILQIIKPNSYLGLHSLFGDDKNYYSYSALEDAQVCFINIDAFKSIVKANAAFAYELLVYVCRESLYGSFKLINQSQKNTNGRIADLMLHLSENIYNSNQFEMPLTRQEISEIVGVSRENASRVISKFKADKIIQIKGKNIKILKTDLLRKISLKG